MFHNRLLAALLLAALLITTLAVTACNSTDPPPIDTTAATEADTTAAPKPASLALVADGKTAFTIIRAEEAEDDDTIDLLKRIMTAFEKNTGVRIALGTDWKKKGEEPNAESYEILVGATNHPESAQALEGVKYRDFAVVMIGNQNCAQRPHCPNAAESSQLLHQYHSLSRRERSGFLLYRGRQLHQPGKLYAEHHYTW